MVNNTDLLSHNAPIEMVALDLDGTLMGSDLKISVRVCQAVHAVQLRGVPVILATGRMFSATLPFAVQLNIQTPLICYQGGWIQAPDSSILFRKILPKALAKAALTLGNDRGWHAVLYADGRIYTEQTRYPLDFYETLLGPDPVLNSVLDEIVQAHEVDKVLFVAEPDAIPAMAQLLSSYFGQKAEVVQSHRMFVEMVPQTVNKGRALAWLASQYKIPRQKVLAIGDQENDIPMIQWSGKGIAMGNAVPAVHNVADWIAPTLEEDGAAVALERFVLDGGAW